VTTTLTEQMAKTHIDDGIRAAAARTRTDAHDAPEQRDAGPFRRLAARYLGGERTGHEHTPDRPGWRARRV